MNIFKILNRRLYPESGIKVIRRWNNLLRDIQTYLDRQLLKHMSTTTYTNSLINKLTPILKSLPEYNTTDADDMFDYYNDFILPIAEQYTSNIETIYKVNNKPLISNSKDIVVVTHGTIKPEYLLTSMDDYAEICPIRISCYNTTELPVVSPTGVFEFKQTSPDFIMVNVDLSALLLMYSLYIKSTNVKQVSINAFIKENIIPQLFDDFYNCWVLNIILLAVQQESLDVSSLKTISREVSSARILNAFKDLSLGLKKISMNELFNSELFPDNSLNEILNSQVLSYKYKNMMRYIPYQILNRIQYFLLIFNTLSTKENIKNYKQYFSYTRKDLLNIRRTKYLSKIQELNIRLYLDIVLSQTELIIHINE